MKETLIILLQALETKRVTIDLRNETQIQARLDEVDADMKYDA